MNRWFTLLLYLTVIVSLSAPPMAGDLPPQPAPQPLESEGENFEPLADEISPAAEQAMTETIQRNLAALRLSGGLPEPAAAAAGSYAFPLRLAAGLPDDAGFKVSAFPDHNPAAGQALDYNGGTRTYDGHRGTDFALWPFGWNKLNAGEMQVVAAAAGTIVALANGTPADHNCNGSSDPWNYVALVHADGRMTIYGHLRYNSLTPKGIGQTVTQGEFLGLVGSSGNSSGPHLHFEVRYGSFANTEWIDPYAGPNSQPESLWVNQRPYRDSAINRLATHSAPPSTPDPCQPSIPNLQDSFSTPARVYFYAFYRDYQGALITQLRIYRPDGSLYSAWAYAQAGNPFYSTWTQGWVYDFTANDPAGTWRFEAEYNGQVYTSFFNLNAPPAITVVSPNGGEQWERQAAHSLTWSDNLGGEVNLALYHNGVYSATIASNLPSSGVYLWTPGSGPAAGPGYTLRVTSVTNPAVYDASNAAFTLTDPHLAAQADYTVTAANTPVTIDVLGNDLAPSGAAMTISDPGAPLSGTVNLVNARLEYAPAPEFLGTEVFTYTVSAGGEQAQASVHVLVVSQVLRLYLPLLRRP